MLAGMVLNFNFDSTKTLGRNPVPSPWTATDHLSWFLSKAFPSVVSGNCVSLRAPRRIHEVTGSIITQLKGKLQMGNCLLFADWTYRFLSANSFSAWLSNDRSSTNRFKRVLPLQGLVVPHGLKVCNVFVPRTP